METICGWRVRLLGEVVRDDVMKQSVKKYKCHSKEVSIVYINQEFPTSVDTDPFSHQGFWQALEASFGINHL